MATFYLDFQNGDDGNDGSSWALAWKTITSGALAARIAAGDVIKIAKSPAPVSIGSAKWTCGPYSTTTQTPTSSTNASPIVMTKNGHGYVDGDILHIVNHTVNTAANGVWEVYLADANTFALKGSVGNGAGAGTGQITKINSKAVILSTSGLTKNVDKCESVWTLANGAAVALENHTYSKQGAYIQKVTAPASPATDTLYAYKELDSAVDFSGYQKLSFWIDNQVALSAGNWKLCLCSDAAGATIVDEFAIPAIASAAYLLPLTLERTGGGNLGNSIQSVALYSSSVAPAASGYVRLDNIIACAASGINLQSLISKNSAEQGGEEAWHGIQSIDDTIVLLDNNPATKANAGRGYYGTSETVTTYIRETIKVAIQTSSAAGVGDIQDSGTSGSLIEFQGGYNTATGSQDGETFIDYLNGSGRGIYASSKNYIELNHLSIVRSYYGYQLLSITGWLIDQVSDLNNTTYMGFYVSGAASLTVNSINNAVNNGAYGVMFYNVSGSSFGTLGNMNNNNSGSGYGVSFSMCPGAPVTEIKSACNNSGGGLYVTTSEGMDITTLGKFNSNGGNGVHIYQTHYVALGTIADASSNAASRGLYIVQSSGNVIHEITNCNSNQFGITFDASDRNLIKKVGSCNNSNFCGLTFTGSWHNTVGRIATTGSGTRALSSDVGINYVNHAVLAETTKAAGFTAKRNGRLCLTNYNDDSANHWIYTDGGTVNTDGVIARSGVSWKFSFSDATRVERYPIDIKIAKIAVEADKAVTVKAHVRRNNTTDVGLKVLIRGGQLAGMPLTDIVATAGAGSAGTWEQITLETFTPTEKGVVEIEAHAYYIASTAGNAWIDDLIIEQAA